MGVHHCTRQCLHAVDAVTHELTLSVGPGDPIRAGPVGLALFGQKETNNNFTAVP
jgi:hypothetical protein